jgi:hypothetical protein
MTNITIMFHQLLRRRSVAKFLTIRERWRFESIAPAGQNPYHTPVRVCTSPTWVTIRSIRRWVWTESRGSGDGWCQVAQIKPAHSQGQVAQVMPTHGQPRPSASFLASPRCVPQSKSHLERGTWLHSQNELSGHYVKGTFNLNQGPNN